ncbi:MAG TPA: M12 family metallo-peptidase [Gaiellaceae bacterium]|nr:M12 family metallo-peptidase [Gaiellaceae bacterium]
MNRVRHLRGRLPFRRPGVVGAITGLAVLVALAAVTPAAAAAERGAQTAKQTRALWTGVAGTPRPARAGARAAIRADRYRSFRLDRAGLRSALARAPRESAAAAPFVVSLPAPGGGFQRFAVELSPVMEPALARKHPAIKTFAGRGIDDPAATIRADIGPLGFHASVRSPKGSWYIDPYYKGEQSLYVSYYTRDAENTRGAFVEREGDESEAEAFAAELAETLAVPEGPLVTLRTYRLALLSDPTYANYFGGNTTAAKVTLVNRVNQIYEDETAIRMVLVGNNDLINLDTPAQMTGPNGPCGSAPCYTPAQATSCGGATLTRTRIVIGQLIGASNYDVGHIGLGNPGGGVASLGVVGGNNKAQGCTGLSTPVGDFFAVDYVSHEIGHQFAGNHTFNGTQSNCSGGNRSAANSFEPGSGSSIMAYAGICQQDNLQPHSDPYWSFRSFQEITALVTGDRPPINEVQNVSLTGFSGGDETQTFQLTGFGGTDSFQLEWEGNASAPIVNGTNYNAAGIAAAIEGIAGWPAGATLSVTSIGGTGAPTTAGFDVTFGGTLAATDVSTFAVVNAVGASGIVSTPFNGGPTFDSFTLSHEGATTVPIVNDANYTAAGVQEALQGPSEVQTVTLDGFDADGDSFTLAYGGADTHAIVRGQNSTAAGIQNALQGGNEQQQAILTGFSGATQSFQIELGGSLSAVLGSGGLTVSNANVAAAVNAIPGFAGTVTSSGAGNGGFTLTFSGASANVDVPSISIVNCTAPCTSSVRELAKGGTGVAGWPAGGTVSVGSLADTGFTLTFSGAHQGTDVGLLAVTNGTGGVSGSVAETVKGAPGILPIGATATVAPFGATGIFNDFGFQVTFGGALGLVNTSQLALTNVSGFSGYVGETAKGGPVDNKGWVITETGNHAPVVTTEPQFTIPTRTPFALTGSATDFDGDPLTYLWEQTDRGGTTGTALVNNTKANGPLFRQFGTAANVTPEGTLLTPSPGLNAVGTDPTRVFPDLAQILANNTNAVTGVCPAPPPAPTALPPEIRECYSEFLPTIAWVGFLNDRTLNFKLTARDGNPGAGGIGSADTRLVIDPLAGPFLVTSQATSAPLVGGSAQPVTWDVAGTNVAPIGVAEVKISLSVDGGATYPYVLAAATANDGSETVTLPNVATTAARIKVEAVGNVFFDLSETDFTIQAVPVLTTFDRTVQYSDGLGGAVVVSATDDDSEGSTLSASATGLPAGLTLAVSATSGAGVLPGTRSWTLAGNVTAAPGIYPVSVTVTDGTGGSSTASFTVTVTQEDAAAVSVGDAIAFAGPGGTATILFRATVRDSAVVSGSGDAAPGDVSNATVTFRQGATTLCGPIPVGLLNSAVTIGSASCSAPLGLGLHDVDVVVGGYYTGLSSTSVRVLNPEGTSAPNESHVDGKGNIAIGPSAGTRRADSGSLLYFEFDVKFNTASGPTGYAEIEYTGGGRTYRIRADGIDQLGAAAGNADFRATATLTDITNRRRPVLVADGLTLHVTADGTDPDAIGLTLWDGNRLVLSSRWTGWSTAEQALAGGRIDVR